MTRQRRKREPNLGSQVSAYTGQLAKPISVPIGAVGMLGEAVGEAEKRIRLQQLKRLSLLFEWYGIDPEAKKSWCYLAIRLAFAHVPGMRANFSSATFGRPRSWKAGLDQLLLIDAESVIAAKPKTQKRMGFEEAIAILRNDKTKEWHKFSQENLVTREREARAKRNREEQELLEMLADPSSLPNAFKLLDLAASLPELNSDATADEN